MNVPIKIQPEHLSLAGREAFTPWQYAALLCLLWMLHTLGSVFLDPMQTSEADLEAQTLLHYTTASHILYAVPEHSASFWVNIQ